MPEIRNQYHGIELLLLREDKMARGQVVVCKHNAEGNVLGRGHTNPILDNRVHTAKSLGGETTEFTINIIENSECIHVL